MHLNIKLTSSSLLKSSIYTFLLITYRASDLFLCLGRVSSRRQTGVPVSAWSLCPWTLRLPDMSQRLWDLSVILSVGTHPCGVWQQAGHVIVFVVHIACVIDTPAQSKSNYTIVLQSFLLKTSLFLLSAWMHLLSCTRCFIDSNTLI